MKLVLFVFSAILTGNFAFSSVCKLEFEETICENFEFSPEIILDSAANNKVIIKNAKGKILKKNLSNLKIATELIVTESLISEIEEGALCTTNLTSLSFINNKKIPKITRNVLKDCQRLIKIYSDGPVVVENGAFTDAVNVQTLTLNKTILPDVLEEDTFQGLDSLKTLSIRHSKLKIIKEDAFADLKNLKFLDLQYNDIEEILPKTFRKLLELKVLNLGDNKLKNLRWDEFHELKNLRVLFLERNNFENVNVDKLVEEIPDLERIFLSYNKLKPQNRKQIEDTLTKFNITLIYSENEENSNSTIF